ncbi:MAG: KaiC domain-containing protein [Euryarchaeota archaeon]|nr:KaiC domain-containing protein [Euryarchaeota archaeon]
MGDRVGTGIAGLDQMLEGGVPAGHIVAVIGSCGTGKTTLALQYLAAGLKQGEKGIFISLEEDEAAIMQTSKSYGWDIEPQIASKNMAVFKIEPSEAKVALARIKTDLPNLIKSMGAKRLVLDSVSLLNMLSTDEAEKRSILFALCQQIKGAGATALLTAEARPENPTASRDGLVEYVADGVIVLSYVVPGSGGDVQLSIRVMKMRRTKHSRAIKPYNLTSSGMEVLSASQVF